MPEVLDIGFHSQTMWSHTIHKMQSLDVFRSGILNIRSECRIEAFGTFLRGSVTKDPDLYLRHASKGHYKDLHHPPNSHLANKYHAKSSKG